MVLNQDDADPQRDFYEDEGLGEDVDRDFNRPTMRRKNQKGPGLDINEPYHDQERWNRSSGYRRMSQGPYSGVGPYNYQRGDERIFEDVCRRLTDHGGIDARDINVHVGNGDVTLRGAVANKQMRRLAEDVAGSVPGVKDVFNELRYNRGLSETTWSSQNMKNPKGLGQSWEDQQHGRTTSQSHSKNVNGNMK